ncbi:hypothetical protein IAR55_005058 [Kwoniella newhampshirensis]|uniref:Uncharacterized protein n=1 Tax=Kwoniella newhampshirensis TaxID=1651941 RepID=A0AAW0YWK1_9TREE
MAVPYNLWGTNALIYPTPTTRGGQLWAVPQMLPSSNPFIANPEGAIRDMAEHDTNGDSDLGPDDTHLNWYETWAKDEESRKIIMDVIKARLELQWPYNYKALLLLAKMPDSEIVNLHEKLGKLADSPDSVKGAKYLKELAKPLLEKAKAEIAKKEEEEGKKKQEAIMAMWGGLWANNNFAPSALQVGGYLGWPYPYTMPPGTVAHLGGWNGKPPDGWNPTPITALPQVYPFSRTGYYGLQSDPRNTWPDVSSPPQGWWVHVGTCPHVVTSNSISKSVNIGLTEIFAKADNDLTTRGW